MNIDYDKFWDEITKEAQEMTVPLRDGEMTITMFVEKTGLKNRPARERLESLVKAGKLSKRFANIDGHRTAIYFPNTH